MAKEAKYDASAVLADWKTGKYSVRGLAKKHDISVGTVHSMVKGVEKSIERLVGVQVEINQELMALTPAELNIYTIELNTRSAQVKFFADSTIRNLSSMVGKIGDETTVFEHRIAQAAIKDGRETVLGKQPETAIQINNNGAGAALVAQQTPAEIRAINDALENAC